MQLNRKVFYYKNKNILCSQYLGVAKWWGEIYINIHVEWNIYHDATKTKGLATTQHTKALLN